MKNILLLLLYIIIVYDVKASSVIIKINNYDCINCHTGLSALASNNQNVKLNFIFEDEFKNDTKSIEVKYKLNKFSDYNILFSDSLYKYYSKSPYSEILITTNSGKVIFRDLLKNFNYKLFSFILNKETDENSNIILDLPSSFEKVSLQYISLHYPYILMCDNYDNFTIWNINTNKIYPIQVPINKILNQALALNSENFTPNKIKIIRYCIDKKNFFQLEPQIQHVTYLRDSAWLLNYKLYNVEIRGSDTTFYPENVYFSYNPFSNNIKIIGSPPQLKKNLNYYSYGYYYNNELYCAVYPGILDTSHLQNNIQLVGLNIKNNKLSLKKYYNFYTPKSYINNGLKTSFQESIFRYGLYCLVHSDSIFQIDSNKCFSVPLLNECFNNSRNNNSKKQPNYKIFDLFKDNNDDISILYFCLKKQLDITTYNPLVKTQIRNTFYIKEWDTEPKFFINSNYIIYKVSEQNRFNVKYVGN